MSFLYKGISSQNYMIVEKVFRSILPPISHVTASVAKKPGAFHQQTNLEMREISFNIRIREENVDNLNAMIRSVASWLYAEEPQELVLEKEPDKYYMAVLDGNTDLEELIRVGKGTLSFLCTDPIGYDRVVSALPITQGVDSTSVTIGGTFKTFPIIQATMTKNTTFFSYATENENEQVILGTPVNLEEQAEIPLEELQLEEIGTNLTGWSEAGTIIEDGVTAGAMQANGNYFTYSSLGTGTGWHGPTIKKALPTPLDNWKVDWWINFQALDPKMLARIQLYLLDVNGNVIHKLTMHDSWEKMRDTYGSIRLGSKANGHDMINTHGSRPGLWNNFNGMFRLMKQGNRFEAYIAMVDRTTYRHHTRASAKFTDTKGLYTEAVAQVELHIGQFGTKPVPPNNLIYHDVLRVYKRNLPQDNEVPTIARTGDVIEIDHFTKSITKNGEPFKYMLDPISNLFSLQPGTTHIGFQPNDVADIELLYRNRWL